MRGSDAASGALFSYVDMEVRVPATHPLRTIRTIVNEVLAALEAVDLVVIFAEDTPLKLIERIKPSVLVKGGDYTREQVVGHEIVTANGGEIVLVEIMPGHSTTSLVKRARENMA